MSRAGIGLAIVAAVACGWRAEVGPRAEEPLPSAPGAAAKVPEARPPRVAFADPARQLGSPPGEFPAVQERVPQVTLWIAPADLAELESDPGSDEFVPATMELDGQKAPARLRYRGSSTRTLPQRSFKVKLEPGFKLDRRDHFELLAEYRDSGKLTEKFAVDLFEALRLPVPRAHYLELSINGQPNGVYLDMEHVGGEFLRDHGLERGASIYRCGSRNCEMKLGRPTSGQQPFEKKTNQQTADDDLEELLSFINRADEVRFEREAPRRIDLEAYLGNLAADALISNNIIEDSGSYWVHELGADRWTYVPWDLNNARMFFWRTSAPSSLHFKRDPKSFCAYDPSVQAIYETRVKKDADYRPAWNVLATRLWDRPPFRARILAILETALSGPFAESKADAHVDALWALIGPRVLGDPYVDRAQALAAPGYLKGYLEERRTFLQQVLDELRRHGQGGLVLNEIGFGGSPFVELLNRGPGRVSLDGLTLTNDLRAPHLWRLPSVELEPSERYVVRGIPFAIPREGGELGLFDGSRVYGPLDAVFYGPGTGDSYGRSPDGGEELGEGAPSSGQPNP